MSSRKDRGQSVVSAAAISKVIRDSWPNNRLSNLYLFGSRLYECHKPDSDYDFIGICEGEYFYAYRMVDTTLDREDGVSSEKVSVNVNMMHITYFKECLNDAFINCIMLCFVPKDFIWMELIDIQSEFLLHLPNIRQSVQMDSTHNMAKAKRLWRQGDYYTSKKNVVHGIRYLNYSLQLLGSESRIYDFTVGNEYWTEVMSLPQPAERETDSAAVQALWKPIEQRFTPIYEDLTDKMKRICDSEVEKAMEWEVNWISNRFKVSVKLAPSMSKKTFIPYDILIDYVREYGFDAISKRFGVVVSRHGQHNNLVSLSRTAQASLELNLVQWCSGIIIDEADDLKVVAVPFSKMFATSSNEEMLPEIDWTSPASYVVEEHLDGRIAMLYWYRNEWHVASSESADGGEQIGFTNPIRLVNWRDYIIEGFNFNPVHQSKVLITIQPGSPNPFFSQTFWSIFNNYGVNIKNFDPACCYLFEVQSRHITNVVEHVEDSLVLLGIRNMTAGGAELDVFQVAQTIGWTSVVPRFVPSGPSSLSEDLLMTYLQPWTRDSTNSTTVITPEEVHLSLRFLDPLRTAGFVVVASDGRRLAFRSPQFASLARLNPLCDIGQVQRLLAHLVRCLCPRSFLRSPSFLYWINQFNALDQTHQFLQSSMEKVWEDVKKTIAAQDRAAGASIISNFPLFASELFYLVKLQLFDRSIKDHLSRLPLKRYQHLLRRTADQQASTEKTD